MQEIKLGSQVTEIGDMAFALCTSLETFTFPETVTAVGLKLFFGCAKLQEVTLPESLTTLGTQMFFSCPALESITIPASVEDVGVMAFSGCTGLKEIVVADGNEYFTVHEGALFDKFGSTLLLSGGANGNLLYGTRQHTGHWPFCLYVCS